MNFMKNLPPFPILATNERISLREHEPSDAEAFFNYYTHSQVTEFNIAAPTPKTLQEAKEEVMYCRSLYYLRQGIYWAICEQSNPIMIGAIGIHLRSQHHGEIHYDLDVNYWNQGIMTQAMETAITYCFEHMNLTTLEARTLKANSASIRILEKLGFQHDHCIEKYTSFNGQQYTIEVYQLHHK